MTHVLHRCVANERSWLTEIFFWCIDNDLPCMRDMHLSWRITWHHRKDDVMCDGHTFHYKAHISACFLIFCALLMHFVPRSNDIDCIGVKVLNSPDGQVETYQFILLKQQRWWSTAHSEVSIQGTQNEVCSGVSNDTYKSIWAVPYIVVISAWQMPVWISLLGLD